MNNANNHLLIEIGVSELPTQAVKNLHDAFLNGMQTALQNAGISFATAQGFATARRLAVLFSGVAESSATQMIEKKGPSLAAAKDSEGNWSKAATGFAQSCGVRPDDLVVEETDKGAWLFYRAEQAGQASQTLIPKLCLDVIAALPLAKRMRWGDLTESFVRPVTSLCVLWNEEILPLQLFGVQAGRQIFGHRYHGAKQFDIASATDYESRLNEHFVIADLATRKASIQAQVSKQGERAAPEKGSRAVIDEALLDEVNALVEFPQALTGSFDPRFLHVPQAVLIKTMQDNQKYFPVVDADGQLLPYFITVANIASKDPEIVKKGNERVITPRFADAEFFLENDKKKPLASRIEALKNVVFQEKLGSLWDKTERLKKLVAIIADMQHTTADVKTQSVRAAELAKCDLVTDMVFEFGELQGLMGEFYARHDGEEAAVATAIAEQYLPKFAGDDLPKTETGLILSLAEKIDNLLGGFSVGAKPTGTKDPYALRRASLGVIRLLNESPLNLPLKPLLEQAATLLPAALKAETQVAAVLEYIHERLRGYYLEAGFSHEQFAAVSAVSPSTIKDFSARMQALMQFMQNPDAPLLLAANKRIDNLLKKATDPLNDTVDVALFSAPEATLYEALNAIEQTLAQALANGNYQAALAALATLKQPLDTFFDEVMVMTDDLTLRHNRLCLLAKIHRAFLNVADVSLIDKTHVSAA